jgi:hypothetical protein
MVVSRTNRRRDLDRQEEKIPVIAHDNLPRIASNPPDKVWHIR